MWNTIKTEEDIKVFMEQIGFFHDSCIKEMSYVSGAYMNKDCSMYPINDSRNLKMIIYRQFEDFPAIELEFMGIRYLKLYPYRSLQSHFHQHQSSYTQIHQT